jgi:hypothetical protein
VVLCYCLLRLSIQGATIDKTYSVLSTETNAPLFQHWMTGTTFVSSVDIW